MITAAHRLFQVGGFSPLSLAPALWLSDTGSSAGQWDDLSGNGRHATQAAGANQPQIVANAMNGRQVRRFSGGNRWLANAAGLGSRNGLTVFAATIMPTLINDRVFVASEWNIGNQPGTNEWNLGLYGPDGGSQQGRPNFTVEIGAATLGASDSTQRLNQSLIICGTHDGSNAVIYTNGAQTGTAAAAGTINQVTGRQFYVGTLHVNNNPGAIPYNGDIAEIIILPYAATTVQRQAVERYLSNKYAITI